MGEAIDLVKFFLCNGIILYAVIVSAFLIILSVIKLKSKGKSLKYLGIISMVIFCLVQDYDNNSQIYIIGIYYK